MLDTSPSDATMNKANSNKSPPTPPPPLPLPSPSSPTAARVLLKTNQQYPIA